MTKIDIFSGFLGAGKTTLIKKLVKEAYQGEKLVLIENEFGEIGIDGGFLAEAGIQINEMNSGCICCSLVGDFAKALHKVIDEYKPDRILIEPSGVGKLSDVIKAVRDANTEGAVLNGYATVVDANKCKMHMKNFGEFFNDQIANASCIILSHTDVTNEHKLEECIQLIREHNDKAVIVATSWSEIAGEQILKAIDGSNSIQAELEELEHHAHEHHHHDGEECHCHEHHDHEHHHHHHDGEECHCHEHHDHEHHHHHADEVFVSLGAETTKKFNFDALKTALDGFVDSDKFGIVLRAKGIVACDDGKWIHFDYVPGESDVRYGGASVIGRVCVIGSKLNKSAVEEAIGVKLN